MTVLFSIQLSNIGSTILSHYNQKPFNWRNKNEKVLVNQSLSFTTIFLIQIFTTIFTTVFLVTQSKKIRKSTDASSVVGFLGTLSPRSTICTAIYCSFHIIHHTRSTIDAIFVDSTGPCVSFNHSPSINILVISYVPEKIQILKEEDNFCFHFYFSIIYLAT